MRVLRWLVALAVLAVISVPAFAGGPLSLVAKYPMPETIKATRFDHFGVDVAGNRLFLAAEAAHAVLVFDLHSGKWIRNIDGIQVPHAVLYRGDLDRLYVTDGGTGDLKIIDGKTYKLLKAVPLKVDADSVGYDPDSKYLYIDNGGGDAHETFSMFSIVDTTSGEKLAEVKIDGETLEAMALAKSSPKIYINNRAKNRVEVFDREKRTIIASWPITRGKTNVAMALDEASHRLFVGCRSGTLVVLDTDTGKELEALPIEKNVDEVIFDPSSKRIYATCGGGNGAVHVFQEKHAGHYQALAQVPSGPLGKNAILVSSIHRYFVALPPQGDTPGQVLAYQVE
jgi:DNA-binding beta-propeller fold protein YncE